METMLELQRRTFVLKEQATVLLRVAHVPSSTAQATALLRVARAPSLTAWVTGLLHIGCVPSLKVRAKRLWDGAQNYGSSRVDQVTML